MWHVPAAYEAALRHPLTHIAEHATMTLTGVVLWWVVSRSKAYGAGAALAAATGAAGSGLGVLMVFSQVAWYPTYVCAATSAPAALATSRSPARSGGSAAAPAI